MSPRTITITDPLYDYIRQKGIREPEILARLRAETEQVIGQMAVMQISPDQGQFMAMLVRLTGARHLLEIGTFTGYSSLACAQALPDDGHIDCLDVSEEYTAIARRYWEEAGVAGKIDLHIGPGVETLGRFLSEGRLDRYDLAFIDADKPNYLAYYEAALKLVRPGGAILLDNVLWNGAVADPDRSDEQTQAIRKVNDHVSQDERVDLCLVPIGDGITIARRRR